MDFIKQYKFLISGLGIVAILALVMLFVVLRPGNAEVYRGYILVPPLNGTDTFLLDSEGNQVHKWVHEAQVGASAYLTKRGTLLRTEKVKDAPIDFGGAHGRIAEYDWDGNLVWEYIDASGDTTLHHDIEELPNGNILVMVWKRIPAKQAIAAGMNPEYAKRAKWVTFEEVHEIDKETKEVVWVWSSWDHLVQDQYPDKPNFGSVIDSVGKIDLNYYQHAADDDWHHANSVNYNEQLDQILISVRAFDEIWIIDHSISTDEAKGEAGDLLFRWGNVEAYDRGDVSNRTLYRQHDAEWVKPGFPGAGNITVFSNGHDGYRAYSTVVEIKPIIQDDKYVVEDGIFKAETVWEYGHDEDERFYADFISGSQRLPNGNTLISAGAIGMLREVDADMNTLWEFDSPYFYLSPQSGEEANQFFRGKKYPMDYEGLRL